MRPPKRGGSRTEEKWLDSGLEVSRPPAFFQTIDVDMTAARALIQSARAAGVRLTYTHILVRAVAAVLAQQDDLRRAISGPGCGERIDIGLSVSGDTYVAPTLVIENAQSKNLLTTAREIQDRAPEARRKHEALLGTLRRYGWLVPIAFLRRQILKALLNKQSFRRRGCGTLQVSLLTGVDQFVTPVFNAAAIVTGGRVRERAVAVDGVVGVRPIVTLACSADHRVWDGRACEQFLLSLKEFLEGDRLAVEVLDSLAYAPAKV